MSIYYEHTYKLKKKWMVSGLSTTDRQIRAVDMRNEFKKHLLFLENSLPGLIEIQDIAPEPKITCQAKYFLLCFDIFAMLGLYLGYAKGQGDVIISGIIWIFILTTCILLPGRKYKK